MRQVDVDAAYRVHRQTVVAAAERILRDRDAAEDVAQDVFAHLWSQPEHHDERRGPLRPYLLMLARHRALDALRRRAAGDRAHRLLAGALVATAGEDAESAALRDEHSGMVRQALALLAPAQREALVLRHWAGLSDARIAARTSVPLGTVKGRVRLGAAALRPLLGTG